MKFWTKSLMARLVSYFLLLSLVIVGLIGSIAFIQAREALKQSVFYRLEVAVTLKENQLNQWVEEHRKDVCFIAQLPEVRTQTKILVEYGKSEPEYQAAYALLAKNLASVTVGEPEC